MSLHVETAGQGNPLVMLHGWGMHGGVWGDVADRLAQEYEVHAVDLPGHGGSTPLDVFALDAVTEALADAYDKPITLLGWSLGGIIAQYWAMRAPETIERLVLVASTPCFANRDDWQKGMARETLERFATDLESDFSATLRRFITLQVRGSENERELLAILREQLFDRREPDPGALHGGLAILRDADLREGLPHIGQPALVIAGERDRLTLPEASEYMVRAMPNARMVKIRGAAHAPFLSHPEVFSEHLMRFLHE